MKQIIGIIIVLCWSSAQAQDSTLYYAGWGKPNLATYVDEDALQGSEYTQITFSGDRPILIKHFNADGDLETVIKNEYDERGNHVSSRRFDNKDLLREETLYRNDPEELALFRTVFGRTFSPANSNFNIYREYNEYGRETAYYIIGVQGNRIYSRTTLYRDDRRKDKEIIRDDFNDVLLAERRYKYVDKEKRTILEEFNSDGKMVQRVVLFDHHDIIEE